MTRRRFRVNIGSVGRGAGSFTAEGSGVGRRRHRIHSLETATIRIGFRYTLLAACSLIVLLSCTARSDSHNHGTAGTSDVRTATPTPLVTEDADGSRSVVIHLSEPTGRYQRGTLTLSEMPGPGNSGMTLVEIDVSPSEAGLQPVHVHFGTCEDVGPILVTLDDVVGGRSETVLEYPLSELANGEYVVNLHQSYANFAIFTACGDIPVLP